MRIITRFLRSSRLLACVGATLLLAVPSAALARAPATVPTVDPTLVQVARAAQVAQNDVEATIHVIVYGPGAEQALASMGATDVMRLALIDAVAGSIPASKLSALGLAHGVTHVAVDSPLKPTALAATTVDPYGALVTLYPRTSGATAAWAQGLTGQGIGVAVIDSGVVPASSDLGSRVVQVSLPGQSTTALTDAVGHGTFVSDIVAGRAADGRHIGVAPGANVYAINVSAPDGSVLTSAVINGLSWVLSNSSAYRIRVVNLSLDETVPSSYQTSALDQAVERLWFSGIVVVTSAGNLGPSTVSYAPGNDPFAITVGASDSNDTLGTQDDTVAFFSSFGVTSDGFVKPEILATGRHIVSNLVAGSLLDFEAPAANHVEPGYLMANGSSFAAPQVAGATAILLQRNPTLKPDQVKWLLAGLGHPVSGTSTRGLDLAASLAYTGTVRLANQGIAPANGAAQGGSNKSDLREGDDAASAQRAATAYESAQNWKAAAGQWTEAGDKYMQSKSYVDAASAYDRAGADYGQAGLFEEAANAWASSATALSKSSTPEWEPVALEFSARAWMATGRYSRGAQTMEQAAGKWTAGFCRQSTYDAWNKAAVAWDVAGNLTKAAADRLNATSVWDRSSAWNASAAWNAASDWNRSSAWNAASAWNRSSAWNASAAWNTAGFSRSSAWNAASAWNRSSAWNGGSGNSALWG